MKGAEVEMFVKEQNPADNTSTLWHFTALRFPTLFLCDILIRSGFMLQATPLYMP